LNQVSTFALAPRAASSQQDKGNDSDWCNSLRHNSVLQSGKRLSGSSAIRLEATLR
jgi:hypothetical protein